MNTVDLLYNLVPFQRLLEEIRAEEFAAPAPAYATCISSRYFFIDLELFPKEEKRGSPVLQVRLELRDGKVTLKELYSARKEREEALTQQVNRCLAKYQWRSNPNETWYANEEVTSYLYTADRIAGLAFQCGPGDDYFPGLYSEVLLLERELVLKQVNRHNSRSIDHKQNYHLRELVFRIPLDGSTYEEKGLDSYRWGNMRIDFFDHSTPNNKSCGDAIAESIRTLMKG